jgi:class 3 adenylate cyclase
VRILVVDDEAGIRAVCERALRSAGHEVECCDSGEQALTRLDDGCWDLVLSDIRMGGAVDGHEVARRAAAGGAGVALMTAFPSLDSAVTALRAGACDYLYKPFPLTDLLQLAARRAGGRGPAPAPAIEPRRLRDATVLFADARGFTSFAESVSPEEAASRLDAALSTFIHAVHAEGGQINKLTGDGAMAVFGVPLPHPDPAAAAVRAALRARDGMGAGAPLRFGFGVNSGLVAAGRLGSGEDSEYGVIGSVVNVAARLQEHAGPGELIAGEETLRRLGARAVSGPTLELRLKGLSRPVTAAAVLDLSGI